MTQRDERLQDIVDNCNSLLEKLSGQAQTDSTPEGRMISQLKWLKEQAEPGTLDLPVDRQYLSTLLHIYTEGNLRRLAKSQKDYLQEWKVPMDRLISLAKQGKFLLKKPFYPYVDRCLSKLIHIMENGSRPLTSHEQGSIGELHDIRKAIKSGSLEPPVMTWLDYPNFRKVYSVTGSSVDDLPEGKSTCRLVVDLIFEGVRPASWETPEAAEKETIQYV